MKLRLQSFLQSFLDFLISPDQKKYRLARGIFYGVLFLGGLFLLGHFLAWGSASVEFPDWGDVTAPRLTILRNAVIHGELPLQSANPIDIGGTHTYQVMAVPDLLISPQIVLLAFLSIGRFYVFQVLLLFAIGFLGLVKLARSQSYSTLAFAIVFLLFNFNGNILAHLAVGHLTWTGYFLFPWLALLVFDLINDRVGWVWTLKVALLLFVMLLQGSYHQFVWCLFLLGLLGLAFPRHFWLLLRTAVAVVLLSLVRLLPLMTLLGTATNNFLTGFPDLQSLWNTLVTILQPGVRTSIGAIGNPIGTWEATSYVSLAGALFLVYFGVIRPLVVPRAAHTYRRLLLPVAGLLFLSLTPVYGELRTLIPLPIFTGERVISRIMGLVLVLVLFMAANQFQEWLNARREKMVPLAASLSLLAFGAVDLFQNYYTWGVARIAKVSGYVFFSPDQWTIANNFTDKLYLGYVILGAAGTLAVAIFLVVMAFRERRAKRVPVTG